MKYAEVTEVIDFNKVKPFRGFISTWSTTRSFDRHQAIGIIEQFKKIPILTNIQYIKRKYMTYNSIAVSFKTDAEEAAFLLLTSPNSCIEITYTYVDT